MQKRYTILVTGRVQRVGFRGFARLIANRYGVLGYAENLPDGSVRIIAEGEEEGLARFCEDLKAEDEPLIRVDSLSFTESESEGTFTHFEPHFGDFQKEMFYRSELGLEYLKEMIKLQKRSLKMQEEMVSALRDMKKESKKRREVLERVIEAIHTQGVG
ncbi:MAG TPA: acylphosphatase [Methanospirillum sp.]|mgnify:FL=1|uniref:acylphosphatase n=1 Tax=Methanospirillum sp. TaxID=45200 RepID=UPI002CF10EA1|nr:acylphosphatase [Methanospirillum sp.]HOJ96227.1 acylphosphatase [Methanospirillum sp.]HOL42435.1 acylphosphatase [Methanospirillum sp.]HPP77217.1 acylphosphatase [Methanospirillum sp.]